MCGIAGILDPLGAIPARRECLDRMGAVMKLRGPDAQGIHLDEEAGVGLVHRRLSVIDLSPTGAQPMASATGRYTLVFNGEIYNFPDLRRELEGSGARFRGHSDTEVFLAALEAWGLDRALERSNGMFALALWDSVERKLHLVRDRLGIKPLFYAWIDGVFAFASDPNCFDALPGFSGDVDRGALALFLRHGYVPAPHCIFSGVKKLSPGCLLTLDASAGETEPRSWWTLREVAAAGLGTPYGGPPEEAVEVLEGLMRSAVSRRMIADVPLGAFLSGGVDSSAVVALMQEAGTQPVKTFSIGFDEEGFNEAEHAAAVARHLGTDHSELVLTPAECRDVIPMLPGMFAEPFADPSQIPTYLVSRLARNDVTVSLSGDGGDELFAGYHRYAWGAALNKRAAAFPSWALGTGANLIRSLPVGLWDAVLRRASAFDSGGRAFDLTGDRLHKLAGVLKGKDFADQYRRLVSIWENPAKVVNRGYEPPSALTGLRDDPAGLGIVPSMQYWDQRSYLPDDILAKVDRASMAVSLEARVPLLDHTLVEFAWSLPESYHVREGRTKWVLRRVLDRHVPRELIDRPKQGFSVPLADWLRGPLKEWAATHLDPAVLKSEGLLRPGPVTRCWNEFQSGSRQWQNRLWNVLMFQTWLAHRRSKGGTP